MDSKKTLKTLKDIQHRLWTDEETNVFANNRIRERLRQEAIKWVKSNNPLIVDRNYSANEVIEWIKHFFNITEEDLK